MKLCMGSSACFLFRSIPTRCSRIRKSIHLELHTWLELHYSISCHEGNPVAFSINHFVDIPSPVVLVNYKGDALFGFFLKRCPCPRNQRKSSRGNPAGIYVAQGEILRTYLDVWWRYELLSRNNCCLLTLRSPVQSVFRHNCL